MSNSFNRECIVRCGNCKSAVAVYWKNDNPWSKGGWILRESKDTCPICHEKIDLKDLKTLSCPHCGRLVEETPDGICPNCNRVLQDLPEFDWDAMTDAFEDAQCYASYTAFASGSIVLRVCDAETLTQHLGFRPIQFSELKGEADDGLLTQLVRRVAKGALYNCVFKLNGDSLDRLVPTAIKDRLQEELNNELLSYGLRIKTLEIKEAKAEKTEHSRAKELLREGAGLDLVWQVRGVRVYDRTENGLYVDMDFSGWCRPWMLYESTFFTTPEIKDMLSGRPNKKDLTDYIRQRIDELLRAELPMEAQARVDAGEITDIMDWNQYDLALREPMREKLSERLNGIGLTVSEFPRILIQNIAPSPALAAQRKRKLAINCAQCGAELSVPEGVEKCVCPLCGFENNVAQCVAKAQQDAITVQCSTEGHALVWAHPAERCTRGTALVVHENQEAVVFINGSLFRRYGPGQHALGYDANASENDAPYMTVYFVSRAAVKRHWGTDPKVQVQDPASGAYFELGASGNFSLRVVDAVKLLNGAPGVATLNIRELLRESNGVTGHFRDAVKEQSRSALAQTFRERQIGIREINVHVAEFSKAMKLQINQYLADYGVEMPEFIIGRFVFEPCTNVRPISYDYGAPTSLSGAGRNGIRRPDSVPEFQAGEITDDWKEIIAAIDKGTAVSRYGVGAWKSLPLGNLGEIRMRLCGYNLDDRASLGGKAATTWLAMDLLPALYCMNPDMDARKMASDGQRSANSGTVGGWSGTALRRYLSDTVYSKLPDILQLRLVPVHKTQTACDALGHCASQRTMDKLWIPDHHEVFGASSLYYCIFQDSNQKRARTRQGNNGTAPGEWWLRSAHSSTSFETVSAQGEASTCRAGHACGVLIGFCL